MTQRGMPESNARSNADRQALVSPFSLPISQRLDWHLILVWLLAVPAAMPLFQPTITRSADGLLHLYRLVALDQAIQQGAFFPRWLPDLAYGYGLPLFVFYAPLSYYVTGSLGLLGLSPVGSLNASLALALLLSGTGTYLFVKDIFGPGAGLLAGVSYVYAPFQLLNTLSRGSLPAAWAVAVFPFVFWAFGRLIEQNKAGYLSLSVVACGAALLMHNITNLLFVPLLALYVAVEAFSQRDRQVFWRAGLAFGLGLALAAFFLVPAVIERDFVQVQRVITPPDFDYHFNFVSLKDLLALPRPANTGLLNPVYPYALGLAQVGLAAAGLLGMRRLRGDRQRRTIAAALAGLAGTVFMMLPFSVGVWEHLPLIAFVQHPHRLLSLASFLLAILAGAAAATLPERWRFGFTATGSALVFLTAAPLLYPRYYDRLPASTLTGMIAYEHAGGAIGTTSFGEYLPIWVRQVPHESPLEPMYQARAVIERLDRAYLAQGAKVESAVYGFNRAGLVIDSAEPYQAIFHTFYFPGWEAQVDGQPGFIAPVSERGLIGVVMPAGRHQLQLRFRETPVRLAADGLSALALVVVMGLSFWAVWRPGSGTHLAADKGVGISEALKTTPAQDRFTRPQLTALVVLAFGLIIGKALYLDRYNNPLKRTFDGTHVARANVARQANFGNQVNLLGYDLDRQAVVAGQTINLNVYWRARQALTTNYSALAQLVDDQHHLYAAQDNLHPGLLTTQWEPWGFVQDAHAVRVPPGTPPGDYFLAVGLYDPATLARLPVIEGGDAGWSDVIAIPVAVLSPKRPPSLAELGIAWPVIDPASGCQACSTEVRLLGATPERQTVRRNDFLRVALFWEASSAPSIDYQVGLRLLDDDGRIVLEETTRPSYGRYPTPRWTAGERVRDSHARWLPPDFPLGKYRLQVRLTGEAGQTIGEWVELGDLEVSD